MTKGTLYSATATCRDWTSSTDGYDSGYHPRVGHTWGTGMGGPGGRDAGMPGGMGSMANWMSALDESGCLPGYNLVQNGGPTQSGAVGSGGGYGGFYCFALTL